MSNKSVLDFVEVIKSNIKNFDFQPNIDEFGVVMSIYDGVANWRDADAIVTIKSKNSEDIIIKPDSFDSKYTMFAIALIENVNDEAFSIEKIAQYYRDHIELDHAFHWGLNWRPGRK